MSSSRATTTGICGEQDCNWRTDHPNYPLCLTHHRALQAGDIDECPNCPGVYKPSKFPVCRQCHGQSQQQPAGGQIREQRSGYVDDSKGWNRQPEPEPPPKTSPDVVQAVNLVRENITAHRRFCENHETSTIQYLIMPMLKGLGWDEYNPAQVAREYKPAGRQGYRQAIAVDVALMDNGSPVAFIEAKRLDREYDPEYMEQLSKYTAHLEDGKMAALTNGKFWLVCSVANGKPVHRATIDVEDGKAEGVASKLNDAIGRSVMGNDGNQPPPGAAINPGSVVNPDAIVDRLKLYRQDEAKRRRIPPYQILTNATIDFIAKDRPTDPIQLLKIAGVGPATIEHHGNAIIAIVRGQWD